MKINSESLSLTRHWRQVRSHPLVWDTFTTTSLSIIGNAIGFLVPFFIAAWFGVTSETDAFFFAYGIILFIASIFSPVVESVIVPYIAEIKAKGQNVAHFVSQVFGISTVFIIVVTAIVLLSIRLFLPHITRFDVSSLRLIYILVLETTPLVITLMWSSIFAGVLNAYKKFSIPAFSPAFRSMVSILVIFLLKDTLNIHAVALGYVAGELLRILLLFAALRKSRFPFYISFGWSERLRHFLQMGAYQIIGMLALGAHPLIGKTMASWLSKGSVSILHYAERLYMIPSVMITTGLIVTILSHWSESYYIKGKEDFRRKVARMVKIVLAMTIVLTLFLIVGRHPLVAFAFGRGAFPAESLIPCADTFAFYMIGFPLWVAAIIYTRAHMVMKNTVILMKLGILGAVLNFFLNLLLMKYFGVQGIALSTSIVNGVIAFFLWTGFKKAARQQKGIGPA